MKLSQMIGVSVLGLALLAGCQNRNDRETVRYDEFSSNYTSHSVNAFVEAQTAAGSRADATLRAAHFDGQALNSLGQAKLESMLKSDRVNEPMSLYIDVANDELAAARKAAVSEFLETRGLDASQVALKGGANPNVGGMAANGLKGLERMEPKTAAGAADGEESSAAK